MAEIFRKYGRQLLCCLLAMLLLLSLCSCGTAAEDGEEHEKTDEEIAAEEEFRSTFTGTWTSMDTADRYSLIIGEDEITVYAEGVNEGSFPYEIDGSTLKAPEEVEDRQNFYIFESFDVSSETLEDKTEKVTVTGNIYAFSAGTKTVVFSK